MLFTLDTTLLCCKAVDRLNMVEQYTVLDRQGRYSSIYLSFIFKKENLT